jgi:copper chaperone
MVTFQVNDMTCGHCVSTITKALKAVDKDARVQIDLATHRVHEELASTQAGELAEAIKDAGYTPVTVSQPQAASASPAKAGGCCGCCR